MVASCKRIDLRCVGLPHEAQNLNAFQLKRVFWDGLVCCVDWSSGAVLGFRSGRLGDYWSWCSSWELVNLEKTQAPDV